ncbi:MAG: PEP-CTERM sorting domain-containing protein [bacterium]|nr:PEP-CTERM sorting domain-containing protein [bacterium]
MTKRRRSLRAALLLALAVSAGATPVHAQNCSEPGCDPSEINAWAVEVVELVRGYVDIAIPGLGSVTHGDPANIPGAASGVPTESVSLGDAGSVTVRFADPIYDGPDFDFAVFENGISGTPGLLYMELGFVEVSSNGVDFARFPSLTSRTTAVAGLEEADPDDYANFAGHREAGIGSEFDLLDLANHPLVVSGDVDLSAIEYVRIEDVIGDGSTVDSMGKDVYDPYHTRFYEGGFDIDAVGAINLPEPSPALGLVVGSAMVAGLRRRRV